MPELPRYELSGFDAEQRYLLEVWCEKSTVNDVLIPLCQRYGMNLVTGLGELSMTACLWLVERTKRLNKPARIFYISDFDPAGQSMPVAASRKIEHFIQDIGSPDLDIKLIPIALSHEQCVEYKLPRTPIKESERRAAGFEQRFGAGATELDALESLYPDELRKIIERWVLRYFDTDLDCAISEARRAIREHLDDIREEVIEKYSDHINRITERFDELNEEYKPKIQEISESIEMLWQAIQNDLDANIPDIRLYEMPRAGIATEEGALFDSLRTYDEQLAAYKTFQGKGVSTL